MRWYILLAHPNPGSFNHAVCKALVEGLELAGVTYEINDLYATRFNPIMAGDDFNQFEDGRALPADVLAEQAKVERADCLALIYPVWWNEAPAILKGWFDRILSKGWAYDITADGDFIPLLKLKKIIILNTADNPTQLLEDSGLNAAASLTKADGTFTFCGVADIDHRIIGEVSSDEQRRKRFLKEVKELGKLG
ncbi:NAD(P)H oxidoreductase YRKL (EC @ Putative NADPH-quinone reductase (modulator of drug activity B) @ Flavodoxin 2 [Olavius sp. associated proteobacterium Delta 1]|nr:NAD(P)H oxidoreductase YRKL (EC @ Putative NADPH-quinone reductase (modulator of drug activity B) @ Flavodoxin 2 [Olavius sp. associated proteobacterium Delta 1]